MPLNPVEDVPAELWIAIFEEVVTPADLYNVLVTCCKFHSYAIRALHRNVVWKTPDQVAYNLPLWSADPRMALDIKSLELHVSDLPEFYAARFVDVDGRGRMGPIRDLGDLPYCSLSKSLNYYQLLRKYSYASRNLYDKMTTRIFTFANLESLTFRNLIFSDKFFAVIHALPNLRKLHIEMSLFPDRHSCRARDHSRLPITHLSLLNLRRRIHNVHGFDMHDDNNGGPHPHVMADMDDDITHVLRLALAHNLQSLRIDSTADVLGRIFTYWDPTTSTQRYRVPTHLHSLFLIRKKLVSSEIQPQFAGEQLFPERALSALFTRCKRLSTVALSNQLPRHTTFPEESLPLLSAMEGLPEAVILLANGGLRPIEAISLLWNENSRVGHGMHQQQQQQQQQQGLAPPPVQVNPIPPNHHHQQQQQHFVNVNFNPMIPQPNIPNANPNPFPLPAGIPPHHHPLHYPPPLPPQQQQQPQFLHHHHPPPPPQHFQVGMFAPAGGMGMGMGRGHGVHGHGHHQLVYHQGGGGGPAVFGGGNGGGGGGGNGGGGNGNGNGNGGNGNGNGGNGNGNGVTTSVLDAILRLSRVYPRLRMLAVETGEWEDEVLHAVCRLFPHLERLKLTYFGEGPDEITVGAIGPHFLTRLPKLRVFQSYQVQKGIYIDQYPAYLFDPTYETIEEEMRDLVIPWNRYCRALREVQVHAGWKLVRGFEGGGWRMERVREVMDERLEV